MVGRRCVVQGCSNTPNTEQGISVHISPTNKSTRDKWVRFVRTHRANFDVKGRFMICSEHFEDQCSERSFHIGGSRRTLRTGSIPTIWKKIQDEEPSSTRAARNRRKVSSRVYIVYISRFHIYFSHQLVSLSFHEFKLP